MDSEISKKKNLKVIYEQRRERIQSCLENMNLKESIVVHYHQMKNDFGLVEAGCIFVMSLIICTQMFDKLCLSLLLSGGFGFSFISFFNAYKYGKLKKIRDDNPDVDFDNYDFDANFVKKNELHAEIQKIDAELNSLDSSFNYDIVDITDECISYTGDRNYDISFGMDNFCSTEDIDYVYEPENEFVFVKKIERK